MLFHSSIRKELARSFGATLLVLFTIVVTMMLIRTLGLATSGGVDPKEVMLVLGYTVVGRLHVILTMALFIAVVSVLTRMHSDSEMVIWMGSGRGLVSVVSPVMRFAWPVLVTMAVLVLVAWPWANQQAADLRDRFAQRGDLQRVQPGQFQTNAAGNRVFFIDKDTADGTQGRNVFISTTGPNGESTVSAQAATLGADATGQHLLLKNGQRLEFSANRSGLKVSEFEEYHIRVADNRLDDASDKGMKTRSTWLLLADRSLPAQAELTWRLGLVLCAFNVLLVGVAIASANPRAGRSGNVAFAVFAFLFYFNLLNLGETWVGRGRVGALEWTVGLHGTGALAALLWLAKRHEGVSLRTGLRRWLGGAA